MRTTPRLLPLILLGLTVVLMTPTRAQAGFSIRYSDGGHPRPHSQRFPLYSYRPNDYFDRYGRRYQHRAPFHQDRFVRRHVRRWRGCDVIIVRPRYGTPYVLQRYCGHRRYPQPRRFTQAYR